VKRKPGLDYVKGWISVIHFPGMADTEHHDNDGRKVNELLVGTSLNKLLGNLLASLAGFRDQGN